MGKNKNRQKFVPKDVASTSGTGPAGTAATDKSLPVQQNTLPSQEAAVDEAWEAASSSSDHDDTNSDGWDMANGGGPAGTLCKDYELRVRPMIDLIDRLRRIGLDQEVGLPSIVVVGDQSAGKSSVLEAISGVQLPRGSGIVTRCPLELRLKRSTTADLWKGRIQYKPDAGSAVDEELGSPEEVGDKVRDAQDALAGQGKSVSTDLITLEIEAYGLPDLTLIDLPGIVRVTMKGQAEGMAGKIRGMIKRYIQKPETIILTVIPANVDIETSEALQLADEVDPEHIRTLGVITKADMVDKGAEDSLISVLLNERYHLRKGYIAVKCRGQQAIKDGQTLQQALQEEEDFFANADHFADQPKELHGIRSLSFRLTDELVENVQRVLPDLRDQVFRKRADTRTKLAGLGEGVPKSGVERTRFLMSLLSDYLKDLTNLCEGRENSSKVRVHNSAREAFADFAQTIRSNVHRKEGSASYRNEVRSAMKNDRGRELPRFIKYDTFQNLSSSLVCEFDPPSRSCLRDVSHVINQRLQQLAKDRFHRFPLLESKVKGLVSLVMEEAVERADRALTDAFDMENLIFSQDEHFNNKLDEIIKMKVENTPDTPLTLVKKSVGFLDVGESQEKEVDTMFTVIQAYMHIAVNRISDNVPMIIMQHVVVKVTKELQARVMYLTEEGGGGLDALREERNVEARRDQLLASLQRLEEASKELNGFHS